MDFAKVEIKSMGGSELRSRVKFLGFTPKSNHVKSPALQKKVLTIRMKKVHYQVLVRSNNQRWRAGKI
jgi:hypothetical protein